MSKQGFYLVLEGVDFSGKSTIAEKLVQKLKDSGNLSPEDVIHRREPSYENYGKEMREILHSKEVLEESDEVKAAQFMLLDRLENTSEITGMLREGKIVIQERNFLTALAYNEAGETEEVKFVQLCNKASLKPDMLAYIDVSNDTIKDRLDSREKRDAYEDLDLIIKRKSKYMQDDVAKYIDRMFLNNTPDAIENIVQSLYNVILENLSPKIARGSTQYVGQIVLENGDVLSSEGWKESEGWKAINEPAAEKINLNIGPYGYCKDEESINSIDKILDIDFYFTEQTLKELKSVSDSGLLKLSHGLIHDSDRKIPYINPEKVLGTIKIKNIYFPENINSFILEVELELYSNAKCNFFGVETTADTIKNMLKPKLAAIVQKQKLENSKAVSFVECVICFTTN